MDNVPASTNPTEEKYPWRGHWLLIVTYCGLGLFFWLPHSYMRMVGWPWLLVWQLGFLAAGVLAIWMLRQSNKAFYTLGHGLDWAFGLFTVAMVLSLIVAPVTQLAAWYFAMASGYTGLLYVVRNWVAGRPAYLQHLWTGIVLMGLVTNMVSLIMWRPTLAMFQTNDFFEAVRNAMPLGHHNFMGGFEVLTLPLAVAFAVAGSDWRRGLGVVASLLSLVALYASGSRGAVLGMAVMALATVLLLFFKTHGKTRLWTTALGGVTLLGVIAISTLNPRVRQTADTLLNPSPGPSNPLSILLVDGPILDRWEMLQTAANIFRDKPLTGVGAGNLVRVYSLYRPITTGPSGELIQQLHNTPVQILGELGLVGIGAFGVLVLSLVWMVWHLSRAKLSKLHQCLLYGTSISLLAYGASSLFDYQLENIPISITLAFDVVALSSLAAIYNIGQRLQSWSLPQKARRLLSLALLVWLGLLLRLWFPASISAYLQGSAYSALQQQNSVQADSQWNRASELTPWDPIPAVLAAHHLRQLGQSAGPEDRVALNTQAIEYYNRAIATAPNDPWFHHNLANLLLPVNPEQAEYHAGRTVQLATRESYYTYFQLGLAYLAQNKVPEAVKAFALETLADSSAISITAWDEPPLKGLTEAVTNTSAELYDALFPQLDLTIPEHHLVYEQGLLVRWWHGVSLPEYEPQHLRPIIRALFLAETDPKAALALLNERVQKQQAGINEQLLRAWLDPDRYWESYEQVANLSSPEAFTQRQNIEQYRDLRSWLKSENVEVPAQARESLGFAYRNRYAHGAEELFLPAGLQSSENAQRLGLFQPYHRVLVPLDELINRYRAEQLNLPHPTQAGT